MLPPNDGPNAPFVNREMSWLSFNERVLEEAKDPATPLLERVRFLGIFSSNLDEFFMVRYAGIWRQIDGGVTAPGPDGLDPRSTLSSVSARVRELVAEQHRTLRELLPLLGAHGVRILRARDLDAAQETALHDVFRRSVLPVLTPIAIDPAHPFPWLANRTICLVLQLEPLADDELPSARQCVLHMPAGRLPRFIRVPSAPGRHEFVPIEDLIRMHLAELFTGSRILSARAIRVTRDAELDLVEDSDDLLSTIEEAVRARRMGAAVRLQYERGLPDAQLHMLVRALELDPLDLFETDGMTALTDLTQLFGEIDLPQLKFPPFTPQRVAAFEDARDPFAAIRAGDILVHHPFQDFEYVHRLVEAAAHDPDVLAIKMTLYRMAKDSPIAASLLSAARNGKEVAALVELRARFNEAENIGWARRLEAAGAHVVYGLVGKKTHCKAMLIVRREADGIRRYGHLSTGNYNHQTARAYTDLSLFTCKEGIGEDLTQLFNLLTGYVRPRAFNHLLVAPNGLRAGLIERIRREAENARNGRPSGVRAKVNSLADPTMILELYEASRAGVPIDLVVRGICCLRPGVPGTSENIRVRSIVDRFLEHSRVVEFHNDGDPEYWLSSADWMGRNLDGRIELAFPVLEPALKAVVARVLDIQLLDDVKARAILGNGGHERVARADGPPVRSQETLLREAYASASTEILD